MKIPKHKYKVGDMVGIISDCMVDCKILECVPKKKGQALTYIATALKIHHPEPKKSFFGKNKQFMIREKRIVLRFQTNRNARSTDAR